MVVNRKVIVVTGPTASGKSGLAVEIAKAIDGEIISADSMQIYRGLDVGTAKVTKEETQGIPHHLIDICDIEENFSVGQYKNRCYEKIDEILYRKKTPIIVGGTGLYINAVVNNMNFNDNEEESANGSDLKYREKLTKILEEKGKDFLHHMLEEVDCESSEKIHPNNVKRVMRALELAHCGTIKTDVVNKQSLWYKNEVKYDFYIIYIDIKREILYDRINKRIDKMVQDGILGEVGYIQSKNIPLDNTAIQAIGYKELFPYIRGEKTLEECKEKLKQNTRNYAKRQITWFKKLDKDYVYHIDDSVKEILDYITKEK